MSFNIKDIEAELDSAVDGATSFVDLVDKFADTAKQYAAFIPGAGAELAAIVPLVDEADKALHALKSALGA